MEMSKVINSNATTLVWLHFRTMSKSHHYNVASLAIAEVEAKFGTNVRIAKIWHWIWRKVGNDFAILDAIFLDWNGIRHKGGLALSCFYRYFCAIVQEQIIIFALVRSLPAICSTFNSAGVKIFG